MTLKDGREWLSPALYHRSPKRAYDAMVHGEMSDGQTAYSEGWYDEKWTWHDGYGQQPYVAHDANVVSESVANEIAHQIHLSLNPPTPSSAPSAGVTPSPAASASVQARLDALAGPNKY